MMIILEEFPDDVPPVILSCSIDYNIGVLRIFTDEIVDITPVSRLNLTKLQLVQDNETNVGVTLVGATLRGWMTRLSPLH